MENNPIINPSSIVNILTLRYDPNLPPNLPIKTWNDFKPNIQSADINFIEKSISNYIKQKIETLDAKTVSIALSGGVDSSVAAALIHRAIGDQLTCIFVNNGLLRAREADAVREVFQNNFKLKLRYENATTMFLKRLKGITSPERKRKVAYVPSRATSWQEPPALRTI